MHIIRKAGDYQRERMNIDEYDIHAGDALRPIQPRLRPPTFDTPNPRTKNHV